MNRRNLTSLGNSIRSVVAESIDTETKTNLLSEGYINSLTEKSRQTASQEMEEEGEDEEEMEDEEEGEETELEEGMKRLRRLRTAHHLRGKGSRETADVYDKELAKVSASRLRRGGAPKQTVRAFFTDKPTTAAADKAYGNFARKAMSKASAKGKKIFEDEQFSEEDGKKSPRNVKEAVSTGDPNMGRMGRAKPKLPPGLDPYDMYSKGEIQPYGGKLQKRLRSMSAEDRKRYYQQIGIRSRAASRGGKTQRLFPMGKKIFEDEQFDEAYQAKRMRVIRKAIAKKDGQGLKPEVADFMKRSFKKTTARSSRITGGKGAQAALMARAAKKHAAMKDKLAEALQLDEAGYKRLMRLKGAAYKAGQKGSNSHGKMMIS